jgi:hypothetical protein
MELIVALLLPVAAALGALAASWLAKKLRLSPELQAQAVDLVREGVMRAEGVATSLGNKLTSGEKMQAAMSFIDSHARENPRLREYLLHNAQALAEYILRSGMTPETMTPHD